MRWMRGAQDPASVSVLAHVRNGDTGMSRARRQGVVRLVVLVVG